VQRAADVVVAKAALLAKKKKITKKSAASATCSRVSVNVNNMKIDKDSKLIAEAYKKVFVIENDEEANAKDQRDEQELVKITSDYNKLCKDAADKVMQGLLSNNPTCGANIVDLDNVNPDECKVKFTCGERDFIATVQVAK